MRAMLLVVSLLPAAMLTAQTQTVSVVDRLESISPQTHTWTIEVPPFSIEHQVRLILEGHILHPTLSGSNPWITVAVNGNAIGREDLLNKTDVFSLRNGVDMTWFNSGRWRMLYSPDFEAALVELQSPYGIEAKDEPYRFMWDITRHVKPGPNEVRLGHLKILQHPDTLILRNVAVEVGRAINPPTVDAVEPAPTGPLARIVAGERQHVPMQVQGRDATIDLQVGEQTFSVRTRVSLPGGEWREPQDSGQTLWQAGPCRVRREITVRGDHVAVADTFTNTTDELIGVRFEHYANLAATPDALYLAGRKAFADAGNVWEAAHPSVFAQVPELGVGLVAEDDVFRVHARSLHSEQTFGLADDRLGIEARSSVTLEWAIYPVPRGDYWAFVNAVRRNWDVNYTIPGAFIFGGRLPHGLTGEEYAKWMHDRGLRYICGGIAKYAGGIYAHGTGITEAPEFVAQERHWTRAMAEADPDLVPIAYFHAQCCTEPGANEKYADARLLDGKGEHMAYPHGWVLPLFVPIKGNSYGEAIWRFVDTLIDDIGAKGIYWDEMAYSVQTVAQGLPWDGHTVTLDPRTHEVTGKLTSIPLIMQSLKLDIVDFIRSKGLFFMANSQAHTRTMMRKKIVRFVETNTLSAMSDTHLGCPLGLGNRGNEHTQAESAFHVRELLKRGGVYYGHYYDRDPAPWNFTAYMFPITPEEIGPGYVLGQERIHTAVSGQFGFRDGAQAQVYVVNANGERVEEGMVQEIDEAGKRLYEIRMPSDHFAILVRAGE